MGSSQKSNRWVFPIRILFLFAAGLSLDPRPQKDVGFFLQNWASEKKVEKCSILGLNLLIQYYTYFLHVLQSEKTFFFVAIFIKLAVPIRIEPKA